MMQSKAEISTDILQPIPLEEWPLLQELLKVDWPRHADYYYWIQNTTKWKKQDPHLALGIYSPEGKYQDDATFVGISSCSLWSVIVFTKEPSGKKLYEALIKTHRLDWRNQIIFKGVRECIQPTFFSALTTLQANQGIEICKKIPCYFWIKSADECAKVEVNVPEECYLADLNPSHLPLIHSIWPHADKQRPENSMKFLRLAMALNQSLGLFLKEGDVLVSWAIQNDYRGLGTVQTMDGYKRRGYAKVVVNALAKRLGTEGISPIVFVICGNTPSENMFASLNWKPTNLITWVLVKKHLPRNK